MEIIYHITEEEWWNSFAGKKYYESPTLRQEGFIHCCQKKYINRVLGLYFKEKTNLLLIVIETQKVDKEIKYETAPDGIAFPHIYGVLNLDSVLDVIKITEPYTDYNI